MDLTFAEQVKIILSRRGMTIKELAELIEKHTGKKMSRQNLTQRLGRDNFQEQDMRMIAGILGCPFYLNILDENLSVEAEKTHEEIQENYIEEPQETYVEEVYEEPVAEEYAEEVYEEPAIEEYAEEVYEEPAMQEESLEEILEEAAALERENKEFEHRQSENKEQEKKQENRTVFEDGENKGKKHSWTSYLRRRKKTAEEPVKPVEEVQPQQPADTQEAVEEIFDTETISLDEEEDAKEVNSFTEYAEEKVKELQPEGTEEEDLEKGDINPYTGHEYQSNSVRMHPSRIGYVQVYDRGEHKWTDMTEWAFLGYQERKKVLLGKDYEPPIYLD